MASALGPTDRGVRQCSGLKSATTDPCLCHCRQLAFLPLLSDCWRKYQLIEELGEFPGVDVVPYVRLGTLTENLLVDAKLILVHSHVVGHDWIAPSHRKWKRDGTRGRWLPIDRRGDRHRKSCGSERQTARSCRCSESTAVVLISLVKSKVQLSSPVTQLLPDRALPCSSVRLTNHYGLEMDAKFQFTGVPPLRSQCRG
jgi:hypothetical protein